MAVTDAMSKYEKRQFCPEHLLLWNNKWRHNDVTLLDVTERAGKLN